MTADANAIASQVIGLSEIEAVQIIETAGLRARVVEREGVYYAVTRDYRTDRINLFFRDKLVYRADVG